MLKDLKAKFGFKPLNVERRVLVVSSEDMKPTMFSTMQEPPKADGKEEGVVNFSRNNGMHFVRRLLCGSIKMF